MTWGRMNLGGAMSADRSVIIATAPSGSRVTMSDGKVTRSAPERGGTWTFTDVKKGIWTVTATKGDLSTKLDVNTNTPNFFRVSLSYRSVPDFNYTGLYEVVNDQDQVVDPASHNGNWKIRFLTSGSLTFSRFYRAPSVDVFAVGGGGGTSSNYGGGGGRVSCKKKVQVSAGEVYPVTIGEGGAGYRDNQSTDGGSTSGIGVSAAGGFSAKDSYAGSGGNGGGGFNSPYGGNGGYGGTSGTAASLFRSGDALDASTREFLEADGKYYAGGGGGCSESGAGNTGDTYSIGGRGGGGNGAYYRSRQAEDGAPNTGGGAGAEGYGYAHNGGSGILIIRNAR